MKEALVILIVLAVIAGLTAVRYRRQIAGMIKIWRSLKDMRQQMKGSATPTTREEPIAAGPLVNCSRCRTWVPQSKAIVLKGGATYCSTACLETTANVR